MPDLARLTGASLGRELGVSDEGPGHDDQVGQPVADHPVCELGFGDVTNGHQGQRPDDVLDPLREPHMRALPERGRQHNAFHRPVGASGLTQVIEPAERRHPRGDLGLVRQRGAARHELVTAQPQADRVVRSHRGADGGNDLEQEAEPVLEVSAVVVSSGVGRGRQELVDEVAVRAVDLDSLEAELADPCGCLAITADHRADVREADRSGYFTAEFPGHAGRSLYRAQRPGRTCRPPYPIWANVRVP